MIPLTIKHTKEDLIFFTMQKENLGALLDLEFNKLAKEIGRVKDDWIKNKRCLCSRKESIQNKKMTLRCGHIEKRLNNNKKIMESRKKIERMSSASIIINLTKHKPFADKVKRFIENQGKFEIISQSNEETKS